MSLGKVKVGDDMGPRFVLTLLILSTLLSGCVSKPQVSQAPSDTIGDAGDGIEELPEIGDVTEEELTPEVDLEINDTVDLGSLL
jgi:hypothetical protein